MLRLSHAVLRHSPIALSLIALAAISACGDDDSNGGTGGSAAGGSGIGGGQGGIDFMLGGGGSGGNPPTGGFGPDCSDSLMGGDVDWTSTMPGSVVVADAAVDGQGNTVIIGSFSGQLTAGGTNLTASGQDVFLIKLNDQGAVDWALKFGGGDDQSGRGVDVDSAGNIVLVGDFLGSISFGGPNFNASGNLFSDLFVAKLDPNGNHLWSASFGDADVDRANAVAIDGAGDAIVAGFYKSQLTLGGNNFDTPNDGDRHSFVTKLSGANGNVQWARSFGDSEQAEINAVAARGSDIAVSGVFVDSLDFGTGSALSAPGDSALFVAKLAGNGDPDWSLALGDLAATSSAVAIGPTGNVVVGGSFRGSIDLGNGPITSGNDDDIFIASIEGGTIDWSRSYGSSAAQTIEDVAVSADGDVALTGVYAGGINFGSGDLPMADATDVYVAKVGAADTCAVVQHGFGGPGNQSGRAVAFDDNGGLIVAGDFKSSIDFGSGPVAAQDADVFVTRLNP